MNPENETLIFFSSRNSLFVFMHFLHQKLAGGGTEKVLISFTSGAQETRKEMKMDKIRIQREENPASVIKHEIELTLT